MKYDLAIIGSGPGGYTAAFNAQAAGLKTIVIEKSKIGGTCLNLGCIPTKSFLHSANLFDMMKSEMFGVKANSTEFSMQNIYAYKDKNVLRLQKGLQSMFKGIDFVNAVAKIISSNDISLSTGEIISADKIIIATGSKPVMPNIFGIEHAFTSDDMITTPRTFNNLIIIGGGIIALELATFYNYLGSNVTVIEACERILPSFSEDVSKSIHATLSKRGVKFITSARVNAIHVDKVVYDDEKILACDGVLVAVGRTPMLNDLFDGNLINTNGNIIVGSTFQTSLQNIYAIGDVNGSVQLAHVASAQATVTLEHILNIPQSIDLSLIPGCIYTTPEIAIVGDSSKATRFAKFNMAANARALIDNERSGFINLMFNDDEQIVAAELVCSRATDMIQLFTLAISMNASREQLMKIIYPHPTFVEGVYEALKNMK